MQQKTSYNAKLLANILSCVLFVTIIVTIIVTTLCTSFYCINKTKNVNLGFSLTLRKERRGVIKTSCFASLFRISIFAIIS